LHLTSKPVNLLQTGLEVESFLLSNKNTSDYSASAICLAKMFEKEINYSIVHSIRKQHSVDLPRFFNKVQPGVIVKVNAINQYNNREFLVDFNKENNGSWLPPELGKAKAIAKNNLTQDHWKSLGISNSETFLAEWDRIHRIRNKAAHTQQVSHSDLQNMKNSVSKLGSSNIFEKLANLKSQYRSNS
jgi:hypothetical protein